MKQKIIHSLYSPAGELRFLHFNLNGNKTDFVTPNDFLLQVGLLVFPKGYKTKRHRHAVVPRKILYTAEVLIVVSGLLQYTITEYKDPDKILATGLARPLEVLVLGKVGHAFESIANAKIIEVKQGPYLGRLDKEFE